VAGTLVLGATACGDSNDSSTSSATTTAAAPAATETTAPAPTAAGDADRTKTAEEAATKAIANEGGKATVPKGKTLAILDLVGTAESSTRMRDAATAAAKAFGWKVLAFDSGGDADKAAANAQTAVNQGADAIINVAITPALETQGLKAAAEKGIPVINISNLVQAAPGQLSAQYTNQNIVGMTKLAKAMSEKVPNGSPIGVFETPLLYGTSLGVKAFKEEAKNTYDWDIVQDTQVELSDTEGAVQRGMNALLGTHPDVKGIMVDLAPGFPVGGQVLKTRGQCGKIPLYGAGDDLLNLKTIRDGCGTAIFAPPFEATALMAVDQLAEYFARDKKRTDLPADDDAMKELYTIDLLEPAVVTADNLPPAGQYATPTEDYRAFFKAKWADEFGITAPE
jgi:ABC-type sugar transport system substrate-binding protein